MHDKLTPAKIYYQMSEQADLQAVVSTVKNWSDKWSLRLNIDKCKTVSYYLKNQISTEYHIIDENKTYVLDKNWPLTGLAVDSYLLQTSKSLDIKTRTKIKNLAPRSFRYCPLIYESVVICQPPL